MSSFRDRHVSLDGEIIGVAACVNNVVAAFQYGASVLKRAKQQREADGTTSIPKWLEESVSEAPEEIEREKRRGLERFGKSFEIGDDAAIFALNQINVQLQCGLLMKIMNVDDPKIDFKALARAADQARDGTITTLIALRRRLQQAEIEGDMSSLRISTELPPPAPVIVDAPQMVMSPLSHTDDVPSSPPAHRESVVSRSTSLDVPPQSLPVQCDSVTSRTDTFSTLSGVPHQLYGAQRESVVSRQDSLGASTNIPPQPFAAQRDSIASRPDALSPTSSSSQRRSSVATSMHSSAPSFHSSQAPEAVRSDSSAFSDPPTRTTNVATSPPMTHIPSRELSELPKPNRKNDYLGFCKCAWRLQSGDEKAFIKSKDWTQRNASSTVYSLACDRFRCEFKSPYKSSGNPNVIWNKLIVDDQHGLKYRWSFLAKSHVTQKNVENEDYSYQCQFCVFMGYQVPVMNLAMLLEHVSVEHRRHAMSDVILDRTSCVNDRICRDGEKFDINLYPPIHGVEADAFISPVLGDVRDPLWRPTQPVEKYGEAATKPSVFELYA